MCVAISELPLIRVNSDLAPLPRLWFVGLSELQVVLISHTSPLGGSINLDAVSRPSDQRIRWLDPSLRPTMRGLYLLTLLTDRLIVRSRLLRGP